MKPTITCLIQSSYIVFSSSILAMPCMAQVASDGTTSTIITSPDGNHFTVNEGNRAGDNLFHSFQDFSVPINGSAFFNNAVDIANIFSRVTGGNISNIDGLIRANGSANLFIINPAGIIFGANARLDIGGSFLGSTADSLLFEDGTEFIATDGQNKPIITINAPIGLSFRDNPQDLQVQGSSLEVKPNRTLALVGGDLIFVGGDVKIPVLPEDFSAPSLSGGNIYAPSGRIELGSIATAGIVDIKSIASGWQLGYENVQNFGDIQLTDETTINASGEGGGSIQVQGSQVSLLDGSRIFSFTLGSQDGKNIVLNAKDLLLDNENNASSGTNTIAFTYTFAEGSGGNLIINATDSVRLLRTPKNNRFGTALATESIGSGDVGNLTINTSKFLAFNGGVASTNSFGEGQAGNLTVNASESIELIGTRRDNEGIFRSSGLFSFTNGSKDAGNLTINTKRLLLQDGGQIFNGTGSGGNGGILTVNALDSIKIIGTSPNGIFSSAFRSVTFGGGNAGEIRINTGELILQDGGQVSVSTFANGQGGNLVVNARDSIKILGTGKNNSFPSALLAQSRGSGDAGSIDVTTTNLSLKEGGLVSATTFGQGNSGAITINAASNISVEGESPDGFRRSGIFSSVDSTAVGNSGGINIATTDLSLTDGGQVNASTFGQGNSGAITINASGNISVEGESPDANRSGIFSRVAESGNGDSGGIDITATNLSLIQGGRVNASTSGQGNSGAITINASGNISVEGESSDGSSSGIFSQVSESGKGDSGGIDITTTDLSLKEGGILSATTFGKGNAGNMSITASEFIELVGSNAEFPSGLFANAVEDNGNGGSLTITTDKLTVRDSAVVSVGNFQQVVEGSREPLPPGKGAAGNLEINARLVKVNNQGKITADNANGIGGELTLNADSLTLGNEASISAATTANRRRGGIVTLNIDDSLQMRDRSLISAKATNNANGGNVNINAKFIIASPQQNNDIIASAEQGTGGNIKITAEGLFGLEERNSTPANDTNDIDASSQFGLDGNVTINAPDVGSLQETIETPIIVELQTLGINACAGGGTSSSSFNMIGKGGVPPQLIAPLSSEAIVVDGKSIPISTRQQEKIKPLVTTKGEIYPARGIIFLDNGDIVLTAYPTHNIQRTPSSSSHCRKS